MQKGDLCIVYHSSCAIPAAVGIGTIVTAPYPDPLQFDPASEYCDAGSKKEAPRWFCVDISFVQKFIEPLSLTRMRSIPALKHMRLLSKGNRLSVMTISEKEFLAIKRNASKKQSK